MLVLGTEVRGVCPAIEVSPGRVSASTSSSEPLGLPSTDLSVQPFDVQLRTGETRFYPSTSARVRPFDVELALGGMRVRIRPFFVTFR